ncbi:TRAP transporter small permease subunit [Nitratireductor sp. ZSWI3]|uniref:TRAP transporter small permease subunit n=1 Tax=Nitratireductor sp. ZSWI3 TaxID=2966359 RepID=UPI00214F78A7|nr:TRAP transporter small permease subunit [Nitratireductor sp. ZSWI3]MCR4267603.1 TRAP transporter small permease subunit [Nitratireductor sp. ZSWI3]
MDGHRRKAPLQPEGLMPMRAVLINAADGATRAVRAIGQLTAWCGLALVLVVAGNVLGRYLFGLSSVAMQEMEWHLMAVGALFGMAYGLNQGGEVRVDVLYDKFDARTKSIIDTLSALLLALLALVLAWLSIGYVEQSYSINEGSPDPGGLAYRYILKAALPAAFALLSLQSAASFLKHLADLLSPSAGEASPSPAMTK